MADPISAAVVAFATWVGASVGGAVTAGLTAVGVSSATALAVGGYVSTALFYGTQLAVYAGLSLALVPSVPKPEQGNISFKQAIPVKRRGYGQYRTGGPLACWEARKDKAYLLAMIHDGPIDSFVSFYLHDDPVTLVGDVVQSGTDGRYWSPDQRVKLFTRTGLATETAIADFMTGMPGYWTSAHRGDGIAQIAQVATNGKLVHFQHDFPNGEPNPSAVIKAQRVWDPRDVGQDESDPSTWLWSDNPALCYLHFLMYDRGYGYDWSSDGVASFNSAKFTRRFGNTLSYWTDAADVCDEEVELAAGGTEKRYRIGGQFFLDQDETAVVNQFIVSMDGWSSTDGQGGFVIYAGKFTPPTITLTDKDVRSLHLQYGMQAESRVNTVNATFTDPAKQYNTSEADPWVDEAALLKAGRPRAEQMDLPWVQSYTQARRLAKRRMERHQASCRGSMSVSMSAVDVLGQRFLEVDLQTGPEVMQGLIIEVTGNVRVDLPSMSISFDFTAVDPASRDGWTPATDEGSTPPPVDSNPQEPLPVPTIDTISASYGVDPNPRVTLNVTGPNRADLDWELQWRTEGTSLWQPIEHPDDGDLYPSAVLQSGFVPADDVLEFQVRYHTGGGLYSEWSAIVTVDTSAAYPTFDSTTITFDSEVVTWDAEP